MDIEQILKEKFKMTGFKDGQKDIISAVLSGESCLSLMPTGYGKSLCYQLPTYVNKNMTLVISPLIALMKDQVDKALRYGLKATFINSSLSQKEKERRLQDVKNNKVSLLFVTPERFKKSEFREIIKEKKIDLLAVDEAHCISEWGHDFRPDYTRLGEIREFLNNPTTLALTATATKDVQKDILQQLNIKDSKIFNYGFERDNLTFGSYDVYGLDEKLRAIVGLTFQNQGPTIVYFSLIQTFRKASEAFKKLNIKHTSYHGQLPKEVKTKNQNLFLGGHIDLILATPAFGLGIDKPDIRNIIHFEIPGSLESYYQEAGRAGRDSKAAACTLLYDKDDVSIQEDFIKWANPEPSFIKKTLSLIKENPLKFRSQGVEFLKQELNFYNSRDFRVETALKKLERWNIIEMDLSKNEVKINPEENMDWYSEDMWKQMLKKDQERLLKVVQYAGLKDGHYQFIKDYFG